MTYPFTKVLNITCNFTEQIVCCVGAFMLVVQEEHKNLWWKHVFFFCSTSFRHEDRTILMDLKTNGASRETFSALSEKLNKPSSQVSQSKLVSQNPSWLCVCWRRVGEEHLRDHPQNVSKYHESLMTQALYRGLAK